MVHWSERFKNKFILHVILLGAPGYSKRLRVSLHQILMKLPSPQSFQIHRRKMFQWVITLGILRIVIFHLWSTVSVIVIFELMTHSVPWVGDESYEFLVLCVERCVNAARGRARRRGVHTVGIVAIAWNVVWRVVVVVVVETFPVSVHRLHSVMDRKLRNQL